ncbi:MAG: FeoB-associated Cys-rich membrane protein [Sphingobacteriales bacterium]|nr:FeoB-associated Cys-rich membrane protein [Sphingobacteriales bacterium]OJW30084.1 MAG: hypothetical protein BGO54_00365 [Sphingobacteriales bacterium 46-32]
MRSGKIIVAVIVLLLFPVAFVVYSIFGKKKDELPEPAPVPESNAEPVEVSTAGIKVSASDGIPIINDKGVLVQEVKRSELIAASETLPSIEGELLIKTSKTDLYGFQK